MEKEYIKCIDNFVSALVYSDHLDEQEMWDLLWEHARKKVKRLRALDPQRNR